MKILHTADIHIGMENYGKIDPGTGLSTRLNDFLKSFDYLVDYAIKEQVDAVLFAGDAYKTREPSPTHQKVFAARIRRLSEAKIPTVLVVGNHDLPNTLSKAHALDIYSTLGIEHVYVSHKSELLNVKTKSGALQVITLPWVVRSHVLTKDEFKGKNLEEIQHSIIEKVVGVLDVLMETLDSETPSVLVGHATVSGGMYGSERNVMIGGDFVLPLSTFQHQKLSYVALGHLHRHQVLAEHPPVVYSGSIERVDFGEEKEAKGFVVAEIAGAKKTTFEFVPTPARKFLTIEVAVGAAEEKPTQVVLDAIKQHQFQDAVVKVIVTLSKSQAAILDTHEIYNALSSASYVAGIKRDIIQMETRKEVTVKLDMSPLDALSKYFDARNVPESKRKELLEYAEKLVREVEEK